MFDNFQKIYPTADVGCPFCIEEWLQRALREDQQATGLLSPKSSGGLIFLGARARAGRAHQDWKWTVDALWEDERHRLQTAARQRHIDEQAACKQQEAAHCQQLLDKRTANERQEANRCQRLLDERAAYKRQEAVRHQRLLDEETARRQRLLNKEAPPCLMAERAALARQMAAAQTIFLWLCRHRLHVRLAHQTLQRQQHASTGSCSMSKGFGRQV